MVPFGYYKNLWQGSDFSLSVNSAKQMVKLGVSADYGVCTSKRKVGTTCTSVVNK